MKAATAGRAAIVAIVTAAAAVTATVDLAVRAVAADATVDLGMTVDRGAIAAIVDPGAKAVKAVVTKVRLRNSRPLS